MRHKYLLNDNKTMQYTMDYRILSYRLHPLLAQGHYYCKIGANCEKLLALYLFIKSKYWYLNIHL